jgi:hypothetical protein
MKAWKWTRRLGSGAASWKRSISIVLPRPTRPQTSGAIERDPAQLVLVERLDALLDELARVPPPAKPGISGRRPGRSRVAREQGCGSRGTA